MYEFPLKNFYWTLSTTKDYRFRELPNLGLPEVEQDGFIDTCSQFFLGDPNKLLNAKEGDAEEPVDEPPKDEEEGDGETKAKGQPKDSDESEEEEIKIPKR